MRRLGRWVVILAANVAILGGCILLAEAATRLAGVRFSAIPRPGEGDRGLWVPDATKGWFHSPHTNGSNFRGGPDPGTIHINGLGVRGREVGVAKEPGAFRILVFGDSFVFGIGVDEPHVFSSALARRLRAAGVRRPDVINMGVSGYSTDQELLLYRELGSRMRPDVVLVGVCDNDFSGNGSDFAYKAYPKPYFDLVADGVVLARNQPVPELTPWQRTKVWLGRESNVWNAFRTRSSSRPFVQRFLDGFQVGISRTPTVDPVALTAALLEEFARSAASTGARFFVFDVGAREQDDASFAALRRHLGGRVAFLDVGPRLAAARGAKPAGHWDFGPDTHWNVDAHRVAADAAYDGLVASGVPPTPVGQRFTAQGSEGAGGRAGRN